ncbi:MAG: 50S ribosomal protein L10 [Candidatus Phytoplasma stylosanthis]|nr:50S ribosomal protein L10 [Candidatus Phytoplasma stylosanthis]
MVNQVVIDKKKKEVDLLVQNIKESETVIIFEYQGSKVIDLTDLRVELKKINSIVKICSNNIFRRAFRMIEHEKLADLFKSSKALLLSSQNDPIQPIRVLSNFAKKNTFLKVVMGLIENRECSKDTINELSLLFSREHLLAILYSTMMSPLRELVMSLNILQEQKK